MVDGAGLDGAASAGERVTALRASDLVRIWTPRLRAAGIDTARLDAELLIARALELDRERLFLDDPLVGAEALIRAEALLGHRERDRVPVAYLLGTRWFDELELTVTPDVLVPRPETELLVDLAARHAPQLAEVIDVGTGSGAIAIALAIRRPDLRITASDIDERALAVARENAARLVRSSTAGGSAPGLEDAASEPEAEAVDRTDLAFQHASLLGDWQGEVVVSNPPYVEETTRSELEPELAHEPAHALFAGDDGLDVIRALIEDCVGRPRVGLVLIEHGHLQGLAVRDLLAGAGFESPVTEPDLAGHDRVTWARRSSV